MDSSSQALTQNAPAGELTPTGSPAISLDSPEALLNFLAAQDARIKTLELEVQRFQNALMKAGEFIFKSPQGRMISMAFPKEMQEQLKEFFGGN
jgi:hypothetical protein